MEAANSETEASGAASLFRRNGFAIGATVLSMASFLLNDTMIKLASEELPLSQILVVRGAFATGLLFIAVIATGTLSGVRHLADPVISLRGVTEIAGTFLFLTALFNMPIANVTAIFQSVPFMMTILAVAFLGEKVGMRRWTAIAVGFAGVLLVTRPDAGNFNYYSVVVLFAALIVAVRDILTRRINTSIPSVVVSFVTSVQVMAAGLALSFFEDWKSLGAGDILWLALASICVVSGYFFIVFAMRAGEISVIAPFRYTVIAFSLASGYLVWGDVPNISALFGILLITGSGIFVFMREYHLGKRIAGRFRRSPAGGV